MPRLVKQRGFTLIELMISATLGIVLLAALATLFLQSRQSFRQNDLIVGMQDQARFALTMLSRDLTTAGYWGGLASSNDINLAASIDELTTANDCGADTSTAWAKQVTRRIEFINNAGESDLTANYHCIDESTFVENTDVVATRRVATAATASMGAADVSVTLRENHFYLQSNGVAGTLFRQTGGDARTPGAPDVPLQPPMDFYRFYPRIYYIRDHAFDPGDGIPSLCRRELQPETSDIDSTPRIGQECIAVGIQDLQLTWGVDLDNDLVIERYLTDPTAAQLAGAMVARIQILVRAIDENPQYLNEKSYTLGDRTTSYQASDNDHYSRRIYSTTVKLRNRDY